MGNFEGRGYIHTNLRGSVPRLELLGFKATSCLKGEIRARLDTIEKRPFFICKRICRQI